jgi:hypothetical protein
MSRCNVVRHGGAPSLPGFITNLLPLHSSGLYFDHPAILLEALRMSRKGARSSNPCRHPEPQRV